MLAGLLLGLLLAHGGLLRFGALRTAGEASSRATYPSVYAVLRIDDP